MSLNVQTEKKIRIQNSILKHMMILQKKNRVRGYKK